MQEQWHIRVRGKQREEINIDLVVAAVIALGKQLAAEAKAEEEKDKAVLPPEDEA